MKHRFLMIGLGLGVLLAQGPAVHAAAAPAVAAQAQPTADEIEASRAAIRDIDLDRLDNDQDYARAVLRHLDLLDQVADNPVVHESIDILRLSALRTLEQNDQIRTVVDRILARRPTEPATYAAVWRASLLITDYSRAVAVVDQASRELPGVEWAALRDSMGPRVPALMLTQFQRDDDDRLGRQLAEALFRIGWPGTGDLERSNDLRLILVDYRLDQGDTRAAADLAAGLTDPVAVLPLLVLRRYDGLFEPGDNRVARLQRALADYDRLTLEALGPQPRVGPALDRARFLRGLGRHREALALLEPFTNDPAASMDDDYRGIWAYNEAANALMSLDRKDEAVAMMERLLAAPVAENTDLIGPAINHASVLIDAGRHAEALAYATRLDRESSRLANDYGKMWIASAIVCSLAYLERAGEAAPMLERLRAGSDDNQAALMRAYLCLGNMEEAEALVIRRLEGDHPESMVLAFQDYQIDRDEMHDGDPAFDRFMSLSERPAIQAALERVGRVLQLPLSRTHWGGI